MKNPYLIRNAQGHYWLAANQSFTDYNPETEQDAARDLGLTPLQVDRELITASAVDPVTTLICADAGPCLPMGHKYWDGRYSKFAVVFAATEYHIWAQLDGGRVEEITKRYYDYHMDAGIYSLPRN